MVFFYQGFKKKALKQILKTGCACWIFTDRPKVLMNPIIGYFKDELRKPRTNIYIFDSIHDIHYNTKNYYPQRTIIYNAHKPSILAEITLKSALINFDKVYYFASQDLPWIYKDEKLLKRLEKYKLNLHKLTFINIK